MDTILAWLDGILSPYLPTDIYAKLDFLYNGTIILLGAGVVLLLLAIVFMIAALRRNRKHKNSVAI